MALRRILGDQITQPLHEPAFRLFFIGQTVSRLGDRVSTVAMPFLVLALGGSAPELARLAAVSSVAQLAFLLVGGALVDRFSRRTTMIVTDLLSGLAIGSVVILLALGRLEISHLYALYVCLGLCSAFFLPASQSIMPELVPKPLLVPANALRSFANETNGILGPAFAGALIGLGGVSMALGFDAVSFLVGAVCALMIRLRPRESERSSSSPKPSFWMDMLEGFRLVGREGWLWITIVIFAFVNVFAAGSMAILLPLLAKDRFGDARFLGLILSGTAAGALLGAVTLGRIKRISRRGVTAYGGVIVSGLCLIAFSLVPTLWMAVAVAAINGASIVVFGVIWESTLQALVPTDALGRVASVDMLGSFALLPVGFIVVGALVERIGVTDALLVCGASTVLLATLGLLAPAVRNLR